MPVKLVKSKRIDSLTMRGYFLLKKFLRHLIMFIRIAKLVKAQRQVKDLLRNACPKTTTDNDIILESHQQLKILDTCLERILDKFTKFLKNAPTIY